MLYVEKQILPNIFARIEDIKVYNDLGALIEHKYLILVVEKIKEQIPMKKVGNITYYGRNAPMATISRKGKVSRYGSYNDLPTAMRFFEHKFGIIKDTDLRGNLAVEYLDSLESKKSEENTVEKSKSKSKALSKTDKLLNDIAEYVDEGFAYSEIHAYAVQLGYSNTLVTRVLNALLGKPEKALDKNTPKPSTSTTPIMDVWDRVATLRSSITNVRYDVERDKQLFSRRKFVEKFAEV